MSRCLACATLKRRTCWQAWQPMRKRLKRKRRSCGLCKPYKMGGENRWKPKELARLKQAESEIRLAIREEQS